MKIEATDKTFRVDCPYCDEFLEIDNAVSSSDNTAALTACGTWAGMHLCYKRRINIARETGKAGGA